jgi:isocitrate dehydrogenase
MTTIASPSETPLPPTAAASVPITIAAGDGIGPEIMEATLEVLNAAGAALAPEPVAMGSRQAPRSTSGIDGAAWASIRRTGVLLKGPFATPQGGGMKSLNVTIRKTLGLYANVRPCVAYHPFVPTRHPGMDVVIIRENEEDLYAGIEHQQTHEVVQCLKLMSVPGTERIVRYAFEYARRSGRRKVTCMTKDNIMKMTDGLFHRLFRAVAAEYPDLEHEHLIVDIGAARLATRPETFDVVVLPNLYGDILSDVAAEMAGSVGLAGSANIGSSVAMFEAIHGTAPDIAGQGLANPSGLLLAAVMMLGHIGQPDSATHIHNAWLRTLEDGIHTGDIQAGARSRVVGTRAFARAVIERLGEKPQTLSAVSYAGVAPLHVERPGRQAAGAERQLAGVDVFVQFREPQPTALAQVLQPLAGPAFALEMITNRGVKVWPAGHPETFCTDHWRCRFVRGCEHGRVTAADIIALLSRLEQRSVDVIKTENLYQFDGAPGYSLGQGQ